MNQLISIQKDNSSYVGTVQSMIEASAKTYQIRLKKETLDDEIIDKQNIVIAKLKSDNNILKSYLSKAVLQLKDLKQSKQKSPDSQSQQPELTELVNNLEAQNNDLKKELEQIQSDFAKYKDTAQRQRDELQQEIFRLKRQILQNAESFGRLQYINQRRELEVKQKAKQIWQLQSSISQLTRSNYQKQSFIDRFKILEDERVSRADFRYLDSGIEKKQTSGNILIEDDELLINNQYETEEKFDYGVQTPNLNAFKLSNRFQERNALPKRKNHHISPQTDKDQKIQEYARQLTKKEKQCTYQEKAYDALKKENKKLEEKIKEKERQLKKQHKKYKKLIKKYGVSANISFSAYSSDDAQIVSEKIISKLSIQLNSKHISNDQEIQTDETRMQKNFDHSQKNQQKTQKGNISNNSKPSSIPELGRKQKRRKNRTIEIDQQDLRERLKSLIEDLQRKQQEIQKLSSENTRNRQVLNQTRSKLRKKENQCKRLSKEIRELKNQLSQKDRNAQSGSLENIKKNPSIKIEKAYLNEEIQTKELQMKIREAYKKPMHRRTHSEKNPLQNTDIGFRLSEKIEITEMEENNAETEKEGQVKWSSQQVMKAQEAQNIDDFKILLPNQPSQEIGSQSNSRSESQSQREEVQKRIDIQKLQKLIESLKKENSVLAYELDKVRRNWVEGLRNIQKQYCSESGSDFHSDRDIIGTLSEQEALPRKIRQRFEKQRRSSQNRNEENTKNSQPQQNTQIEKVQSSQILYRKVNIQESPSANISENSLRQQQKDAIILNNSLRNQIIKVNIKLLESSQIQKEQQQVQISCIQKSPQKGIQMSQRNENLFELQQPEISSDANLKIQQPETIELKNQQHNEYLYPDKDLLIARINQLQIQIKQLSQQLEKQRQQHVTLQQQSPTTQQLTSINNKESSQYLSYMDESIDIQSYIPNKQFTYTEVQTEEIPDQKKKDQDQDVQTQSKSGMRFKATLSQEVIDEEKDIVIFQNFGESKYHDIQPKINIDQSQNNNDISHDVQKPKLQKNHVIWKEDSCQNPKQKQQVWHLNTRPPVLPYVTDSHDDLLYINLRATESEMFVDEKQESNSQSAKKSLVNFQQSVVDICADSEMFSSKYDDKNPSPLGASQCLESKIIHANNRSLKLSRFLPAEKVQNEANEKQRQKLTIQCQQLAQEISMYKQELLLTQQSNFKLEQQNYELLSRVNQFKQQINRLSQQIVQKNKQIDNKEQKLQETNELLIRLRSQHDQAISSLEKYVNGSNESFSPDKRNVLSQRQLPSQQKIPQAKDKENGEQEKKKQQIENVDQIEPMKSLQCSETITINHDENKESGFQKKFTKEQQQTDHMAMSMTIQGPESQEQKQILESNIEKVNKQEKDQMLAEIIIHETQSEILKCKQCILYSNDIKRLQEQINRLNAEIEELLQEQIKKQELQCENENQINICNELPFIEQIDIVPQRQIQVTQEQNNLDIKITQIIIPQNEKSQILALSQQQIIIDCQQSQQLNHEDIDNIFRIENLTNLPYICYDLNHQSDSTIVNKQESRELHSSRNSSVKDSKQYVDQNQSHNRIIEQAQRELQSLYQPALVLESHNISSQRSQNQRSQKNMLPLIFVQSKTQNNHDLSNQHQKDIFNPLFITSQILSKQMTIQNITPFYSEMNELLVENYLINNPLFSSSRQFVAQKLSYLGLYVFEWIAKLKSEDNTKKSEGLSNSQAKQEQFLLDDDYSLKNEQKMTDHKQKTNLTSMIKRITDNLGPHFLFLQNQQSQLPHEDFLTIALEIQSKYLSFKASEFSYP